MVTKSSHQKGVSMPWHNVAAYFFGGAFLANFAPHFIAGISGFPFYTPFATPPFRGLSSPAVNVLYALFNLAVAYALLVVVGSLELRRGAQVAISAAGFGLASVGIARSAARLRGQRRPAN
jgi:hypothetical protein